MQLTDSSGQSALDVESVERLRDLAVDKTVYIVGSGPSLDEFPIKELEDRLTICLNDTGGQVPCSFWLYGDPKFARWKASKVLRQDLEYVPRNIVMNVKHVQFLNRRFDVLDNFPTTYWFTNEKKRCENPEEEHQSWMDYRGLLPGRWTIATVAMSLATKLGARRIVLLGVDMGPVDDAFYSGKVDSRAPNKQRDYMGQWRKWMQYGFRQGLWPALVQTPSPYFAENCPGTPVQTVKVEDVL